MPRGRDKQRLGIAEHRSAHRPPAQGKFLTALGFDSHRWFGRRGIGGNRTVTAAL
jgi:hypothetical protein